MGDGPQGILGEPESDMIQLEELLILLDQGILGLLQDMDQVVFLEFIQGGHNWNQTHELRNETELDQIFGLIGLEDVSKLLFLGLAQLSAKAHG